jgi:hypothetical protein
MKNETIWIKILEKSKKGNPIKGLALVNGREVILDYIPFTNFKYYKINKKDTYINIDTKRIYRSEDENLPTKIKDFINLSLKKQ